MPKDIIKNIVEDDDGRALFLPDHNVVTPIDIKPITLNDERDFMNEFNKNELGMRLVAAAERGDFNEMIRAIVDGAEVNFQDPVTGDTALHKVGLTISIPGRAVLLPDDFVFPDPVAHLREIGVPNPENAAQIWQAAKAEINPLIFNKDGWLPSQLASSPCREGESAEVRRAFANHLVKFDMKYCYEHGIGYHEVFGIALPDDYFETGNTRLPEDDEPEEQGQGGPAPV